MSDPTTTALYTDHYTLTMAQSFWRRDRNELVSFELFVRSLPDSRGFLLAAGLERALTYLEGLRFTEDDIAYLRGLGQFDEQFLTFLAGLRFTGEVVAVAEGTVIPAQAPILRITAPRIQATLVESALLTIVNHATLIASKAARIVHAADGKPVFDFSLRRLHGPDAAITVARSAYLAGFHGTATDVAARDLRIPVIGTMAHHYVMSYGEDAEQQAFEDFLNDYPATTLLIDTYEPIRGTQRAIAAAQATGQPLGAVRIDSGDLGALAHQIRELLDVAGLTDTRIVATNDLDETKISALRAAGAPIDAYGVGTMLGVSADAPALGGVYKLVEQHQMSERYVMKLAPGKQTDPGSHQLFRRDGRYTLAMATELIDGEMLMAPVMKAGRRYGPQPNLTEIRVRATAEIAALDPAFLESDQPSQLPLYRSEKLWALRSRLGDPEAGWHLPVTA